MNRKSLLKEGLLAGIGLPFVGLNDVMAKPVFAGQKTKNIIFMFSDDMSTGTLNKADLFANHTLGKSSKWIGLYKDNKAVRALMDTASASSMVTDSAAAIQTSKQ